MTGGAGRPAVLVTGAAHRIGRAIAIAFGRAGWHVLLHCNCSAAAAQELADTFPSAEVVPFDLSRTEAAADWIAAIARSQTNWRVLVNSAAIFEPDAADGADPAVFARSMAVNAAAPALLAQAFLRNARCQGGRRVITLTDQKLANPNPDFFSYTLSKYAVAGMLPLLAMGAAEPPDRIYGLAPGAILASHDQTEEEAERSHRLNLLGRRTDADEIADACLFLAGGHLASGAHLFVDSGQHLLSQPRDVIYLARTGAA